MTVDTDAHPLFRVYSAGNFGEVAPERLSPMSWSLVGEPMERATRRMVRRVWGRRTWAEGSHFVFVGYFGCRPYHNLSAYCQLASTVPGVEPQDVANAYFEGIPAPQGFRPIREPASVRLRGPVGLARELWALGGRLSHVEQRVAELESGLRLAGQNVLAVHDVVRHAREVLDEAWACHILCTAGLVPLTVLQRKAYRKLTRHPDEFAQWLTRPRELVWDRLHAAASTGDRHGPGGLLDSSFYEVAEHEAPWRDYMVRHKVGSPVAGQRPAPVDPRTAMIGMLPSPRGHAVRTIATTVGETMAGREQSKSLVMRTLHVFRLALPELAAHLGVADWPYLTITELPRLTTAPWLAERAARRRAACAAALREEMPEYLDLTSPTGPAVVPRTPRGVSPGIASGPVTTPDVDPPDSGSVLVCDSADADIAPLLPFVRGVLSDRGSDLSHIAILCREHQIPCVVGFTGAARLRPGTAVSINGTTGEVNVHDQRQ